MLESMKTVELRKLAGAMGIKGMSSARKEQLIPVITAAIDALHAEAVEMNAPKAPAKPKGKRCESCGVRPIGRAAKADGGAHSCDPCWTKAGMENQHSDDDHDGIDSLRIDQTTFKGNEEGFANYVGIVHRDMGTCWICHPELDETQAEYTPRAGVSRVGQKLHVTLRATGETKAAETVAQLPEGTVTKVTTSEKSGTVLTIKLAEQTLTLVWDAAGRYSYPQSVLTVLGGKVRKVRNVSEALRIAANG